MNSSISSSASDTTSLRTTEQEIDQVVHRLFDLTSGEIALVEETAGVSPRKKIIMTLPNANLAAVNGVKYILDGRISTPGGKTPLVRTIWIIDRGEDVPRLVTAYPQEE